MATTRLKLEGPIFTGEAEKAASDLTSLLAREIALVGQNWIQTEAHGFDKSGRNTGAAADGVEVIGQGANWTIRGGIRQGQYSWPWLEGTSQRNTTTKFRGYKTFRRTRLRLRKQAADHAQGLLNEYVERMGGEA